ncbi:MAG: YicC/YloC family endoribonuclease [Candidatus Eiseniibacteriota bacterium]|jgi:uncharacterized protein (TIGR00255 family)
MKSMTAFGQAVVETEQHACTVEIRTVNHRYCEVSIKMPRQLQRLEASIRKQVTDLLPRGSISLTITIDGQEEDLGVPTINPKVASTYLQALRRFQSRQRVAGELDINTLAALPEFFSWQRNVLSPRKVAPLVSDAVGRALEQVERERLREGKALARECRRRVARIKSLLRRIERRAPVRAKEIRERYVGRIESLAQKNDVDPNRLAQELAILADRLDFTEECVRLATHVDQFNDLVEGGDGPVGRRLNFLLQEMGRETNTIGSKAGDPEISMIVVDIKDETEKLREQVQNVE